MRAVVGALWAAVGLALLGTSTLGGLHDPCLEACNCASGLRCERATDSCEALQPNPTEQTCVAGELRCADDVLLKCNYDGAVWLVETPCPTYCLGARCDARLCEDGETACHSGQRLTCNASGLGWNVTGSCEVTDGGSP